MKYRQLPRTDLMLSEVGFGVWTVATNWWGRIPEETRRQLLEEALELGINFFDTADTYGDGYGEDVLAKFMSHRRHEMIIATKFGYDIYDQTTPRVGHQERPQKFEPEFIRFACEQSLRRLKTDYIDLYQLHNPRIEAIENDEVFEVLEELKHEGKIRYYGSALGPDIGWFEEGQASMEERHVSSCQIIYSILEQDPAKDFFPIADKEQVGLLSRVPHASEALTGRYDEPPEFDENDHRSYRRHQWLSEALVKVDQVKFLAGEEVGRTMSQAAIQFVLHQPTITSVLPNLTTLEELKEYSEAVETPPITEGDQAIIDDLWANNFYIEEPEPEFREI